MYHILIKPFLFLFPAEKAHHIAMGLLNVLVRIPVVNTLTSHFLRGKKSDGLSLVGLYFPNRVGLAAGFDKDGKYLQAIHTLPFGHIEVGTVTPKAQPGNPTPRLFRLPQDRALINRMGFNNEGVDALIHKLRKFKKRKPLIIGGNIGKNKDTPLEDATSDYIYSFNALFDFVDYFTVNVSSPNTPGLRSLQERAPLEELLGALSIANNSKQHPKPLFLKIAPDLTYEQIDEIIDICRDNKIDGIVATNTTIDRSTLSTSKNKIDQIGNGGLSGDPVMKRSTEIVAYLRSKLPAPFVIIGVGGISSIDDAKQKLDAGADLVQIYTGFIYEGPRLVQELSAI